MTLSVQNLCVSVGEHQLLRDVSFAVESGQRLGIVGPSGSGKTVLALALAGLLPEGLRVSGSVELDGRDILSLSEAQRAAIRGDRIGFVFQEPKSSLNPIQQLGKQITESLNIHYQLSHEQRRDVAEKLAIRVGLSEPARLLRSYPHQVSGGQRQRVAIAAAIAASPDILIADEPTTALDVTVQSEILKLFFELSESEQMSLIFITHDLAVLSQIVEHTLVLDRGELVESGSTSQITSAPKHVTTQQLVQAARDAQLPASPGGDAQ